MLKPTGYCKGCKDRIAEDPETGARDCHITCERYKEFKKELAEWYRECRKEKQVADLTQYRPWVAWTKDDDNEG